MPVFQSQNRKPQDFSEQQKNAPQGVFLLLYSTFDKKSIVR